MAGARAADARPARTGVSRRSEARIEAILIAALEVLGERGYTNVTVDAIAARAKASKMTMYKHWADKADLIASALRWQSESPAPEAPDTGDLRTDLVVTVGNLVRTVGGRGQASLIGLTEAIRHDDALRDLLRSQIEDRADREGAAICAAAVARGEDVQTSSGPLAIRTAVSLVLTHFLLHGGPPDQSLCESFVDQVLLPMLRLPVL